MENKNTQVELRFKSTKGLFIESPEPKNLCGAKLTIKVQEIKGIGLEERTASFLLDKAPMKVGEDRPQFRCSFTFEARQRVFVCLSQDDFATQLKGEFTLAEAFSKSKKKTGIFITLQDPSQVHSTKIWVTAIQIFEVEESAVIMEWQANNLKNKGSLFFGSTNPYLRFLKGVSHQTFIEAGRTQVIQNSLTPKWREIYFPLNRLFDIKSHLPYFKVECWHSNGKDEDPQLIGEARVDYCDVIRGMENENKVYGMNEKGTKTHLGNLVLEKTEIDHPNTFLSDIQNGLKLTFTTAFTFCQVSENKKMEERITKLFANLSQECWNVLEPYVTKQNGQKMFETYGIKSRSGILTLNNGVDHKVDEIVEGQTETDVYTQGEELKESQVMRSTCSSDRISSAFTFRQSGNQIENYEEKLKKLNESQAHAEQFELTPFLKEVFQKANNPLIPESYHIVLIVFTKPLHDFQQFLGEIERCSLYPTSFLFLGIGMQDYQKYQILNTNFTDCRPLSQFIHIADPDELESKEISQQFLRAIPQQVTEFLEIMARQGGIQEEQEDQE